MTWDSTILVAIIANVVAIIALFISNMIVIFENKKNRYTSIISKQTLENMLMLRENASTILSYSHPEVIDAHRQKSDPTFKTDIVKASYNIEIELKAPLEMERVLMNSVRSLVSVAIQYYENKSDALYNELNRRSRSFSNLISVYDYSNWLYIKSQSSGKRKEFIDFDTIYQNQVREFLSSAKISDWDECKYFPSEA